MTDIKCSQCGHVRKTTEANPTLVCCENCGNPDLEYVNKSEGCHA